MLIRVFLAVLLSFSFLAWSAESALTFKPSYRAGDLHEPQGVWPFLAAGLGVMDSGAKIRSGGVPIQLRALGSYYFEGMPLVADAGAGLHNEFLTQDGGGSDTITSLYGELAARYRLGNRWQLGAVWNTLVDSPRRYQSNNGSLASFAGIQAMKEFIYKDGYLVRAGGRVMTDVGLRGESINTIMADLQVTFGSDSGPVVSQAPELPPVAVAPHLAKQAMQSFPAVPEHIRFESQSARLTASSQRYLRRLAHNLAMNGDLFEQIVITGHADQRGGNPYNQKLSEKRAAAIANVFKSAGLSPSQIATHGKGKKELLTRSMMPAELARNRRVEIQFTGVQSQVALRNLVEAAAL